VVIDRRLPGVRLDHQGLESVDIDDEVRFLVGTMGMTLIRWGEHGLTGRRVAMLHDGVASKLELIEVAEATGDYAHTAFVADDLVATHAAALQGGCTQERPVFRIDAAGADSTFVRTKAGALVQLIHYDEGSPDRAPWG